MAICLASHDTTACPVVNRKSGAERCQFHVRAAHPPRRQTTGCRPQHINHGFFSVSQSSIVSVPRRYSTPKAAKEQLEAISDRPEVIRDK